MKFILRMLAKPFLGSGIGQKLPLLHAAYKSLWKLSNKGTKIFQVPFDISLEMPADSGPGLFLATKGEYEPFETQLFASVVTSGQTIFDIGAHAGYYSLIAGSLVGEKGKVFAFEPSELNLSLLQKNITKNKAKNIKIIKRAVGSRSGLATFYLDPSSTGDNSLFPIDGARGVEVKMTTIDAFVKEMGIAPNVIKMDVEGAEKKVIDGMAKTLTSKSLSAIFCELTPAKEDIHAAVLTVMVAGFDAKIIDETNEKILPYSKKMADKIAQKHGYINMLFQK